MSNIEKTHLVQFNLRLAVEQSQTHTIEEFFKQFPMVNATQALGSYIICDFKNAKKAENGTPAKDNTQAEDGSQAQNNAKPKIAELTLYFSCGKKVMFNVENDSDKKLSHFIHYYNLTCSLNCCTFYYSLKEGNVLEISISIDNTNTFLLAETENFLKMLEEVVC